MKKPMARIGDEAECPADNHQGPNSPVKVRGPGVSGSQDVFINQIGAMRLGDAGIHAGCSGPNIWQAASGSKTVFINKKGAYRQGDDSRHCGGMGKQQEGSPNVFIGG